MHKFFFVLLISLTAFASNKYKIKVMGADEASFIDDPNVPVVDGGAYDVAVVGAGLAGLTASMYLSDHHLKVLLIEKEPNLGGVASGGMGENGITFDRGAAYWTDAYKEEREILTRIGLKQFKKEDEIPAPIDSYLWKGELYDDIWEKETLKKLPASFALFHNELKHSDPIIPNQPMEEDNTSLDRYTAAEWIRSMPESAAKRKDENSKRIYKRFKKIESEDPMKDVIDLMDLYCRSALGTTSDQVSALAFANFYISEIVPRYTTQEGTGYAGILMTKDLQKKDSVKIETEALATSIQVDDNGGELQYLKGGKKYNVEFKYGVFASQLKFAPKIVKGLSADSKKVENINALKYANYSVHVIFAKGHPYRSAYDTWVRPADYSPEHFTDVILGRWLDPAIRGYEGMRDFKKDPPDHNGIFTIYHPLQLDMTGGYTTEQATQIAEGAVDRLLEVFNPLLQNRWDTRIDVDHVETNRWPFSIHIARKGFYSKDSEGISVASTLRRPFHNLYFAHNNMGTPAFEEALFRGHCAADNILMHLETDFKRESWSRCPIE